MVWLAHGGREVEEGAGAGGEKEVHVEVGVMLMLRHLPKLPGRHFVQGRPALEQEQFLQIPERLHRQQFNSFFLGLVGMAARGF